MEELPGILSWQLSWSADCCLSTDRNHWGHCKGYVILEAKRLRFSWCWQSLANTFFFNSQLQSRCWAVNKIASTDTFLRFLAYPMPFLAYQVLVHISWKAQIHISTEYFFFFLMQCLFHGNVSATAACSIWMLQGFMFYFIILSLVWFQKCRNYRLGFRHLGELGKT